MTISAIRQSAVGLRLVNLTRDLSTRPRAFERLGTLKAETDPFADIDRDLQETKAVQMPTSPSKRRRAGKQRNTPEACSS